MLAEAELNFEKALKLVQAIETANKDVLDLHCQNKMSADVHVKQSTQTVLKFEARNKRAHKEPRPYCYRCGGDHKQQECRFLQEQCHKCGKTGHIRKMCRDGLPSSKYKPKEEGEITSNSSPAQKNIDQLITLVTQRKPLPVTGKKFSLCTAW